MVPPEEPDLRVSQGALQKIAFSREIMVRSGAHKNIQIFSRPRNTTAKIKNLQVQVQVSRPPQDSTYEGLELELGP